MGTDDNAGSNHTSASTSVTMDMLGTRISRDSFAESVSTATTAGGANGCCDPTEKFTAIDERSVTLPRTLPSILRDTSPKAMMTKKEKRHQQQRPIAIIGAGVAGVAMAGALMDHGIEDFVVFDKNSRPGGLWADNYPGAKGMFSVDVPLC